MKIENVFHVERWFQNVAKHKFTSNSWALETKNTNEAKKKSIVLENFPQTDLSTTINHFSQLPKLFYTWIQNELCFILAPKANDGTISFWRKWKIYEQLFITLYIECDRLEKRCVFFSSEKWEKKEKLKHMKFLTLYRFFCFCFNSMEYDSIDFF